MKTDLFINLPFGVTTIDTGYYRPKFDASHLIVENSQAAFVDVGTSHSVPRLLEVLRVKNIPREEVTYVMVTHVHLDHAGGAGTLMRVLPNAKLVVHPRGAPHMIDPAKLIASAMSVYGEERFGEIYGEIAPVPAERVIAAPDSFMLDLNGRQLLFLDTPGHARHHYCVIDEKSRGIFTGDTFGLSFREFDTTQGPFVFPTTSPVQFDPDAMHASIDRLMSHRSERMYLTHYGCVEHPERLAGKLHQLIDQFVAVAQRVANKGEHRHALIVEGIKSVLLSALAVHGCKLAREQQLALLEMDVELNAQGLEIWMERNKCRAGLP